MRVHPSPLSPNIQAKQLRSIELQPLLFTGQQLQLHCGQRLQCIWLPQFTFYCSSRSSEKDSRGTALLLLTWTRQELTELLAILQTFPGKKTVFVIKFMEIPFLVYQFLLFPWAVSLPPPLRGSEWQMLWINILGLKFGHQIRPQSKGRNAKNVGLLWPIYSYWFPFPDILRARPDDYLSLCHWSKSWWKTAVGGKIKRRPK